LIRKEQSRNGFGGIDVWYERNGRSQPGLNDQRIRKKEKKKSSAGQAGKGRDGDEEKRERLRDDGLEGDMVPGCIDSAVWEIMAIKAQPWGTRAVRRVAHSMGVVCVSEEEEEEEEEEEWKGNGAKLRKTSRVSLSGQTLGLAVWACRCWLFCWTVKLTVQ